jgi:hypothetical protein
MMATEDEASSGGGNSKRERWPEVDFGARDERVTRRPLAVALEDAAMALMPPSKDPGEGEPERLAREIVSDLARIFVNGEGSESLGVLRQARVALADDTLAQSKRRYRAVQAIAECAQLVGPWQGEPPPSAIHVAKACAYKLSCEDQALAVLGEDPAHLLKRLLPFDRSPHGKPGAEGGERILATIIVLDVNALGFPEADKDVAAEDEIERVRATLARDVDRVRKRNSP